MKKLDKLILSAFTGPFIVTFLVVVFILLNTHMLKYFDDIIGKGLGGDVIGQLLFYFAVFMTPVAMPLAVLLSSLIAFGNLGEHFELTAIKSAGISLVRALVPIFFFVLVLTGIAFYVNNNMVPKAALEAYSLLYDIKQKKPALDLREGAFYDGIPNMNIKVNQKFPDGVTLKGIIIYDHRKNDGNQDVTVADSGKMYTILNERYLKLELFNGYNYSEGASRDQEMTGRGKQKSGANYRRTQFAKMQVVFDLSSFQMTRTDKKWFQGNRIMRNLGELSSDLDSIDREEGLVKLSHYEGRKTFFSFYNAIDSIAIPVDLQKVKAWKDSLNDLSAIPLSDTISAQVPPVENVVKEPVIAHKDTTLKIKPKSSFLSTKKKRTDPLKRQGTSQKKVRKQYGKKQTTTTSSSKSIAETETPKVKPLPTITLDELIDSVFLEKPRLSVIENAASRARATKNQVMNTQSSLTDHQGDRNTFRIQWHKILASSLACIAMFLIGAPLGAIIKKGGLGVPFLVSILFFIIYYLLTMTGEKWAKQGVIPVPFGVWAADVVLFIVGLIFLRQARLDARLFEADFYSVQLDKARKWLIRKKILKEPTV